MNEGTKTVLLYGDSFIWGLNPVDAKRYDYKDRIGGLLQAKLGEDYRVVEEGHRGRTMFGENGWFPERNGLEQFGPIFASHLPVDVLVIMLGTNDLNSKTNHSPQQIAASLNDYDKKIDYWCNFMKYDKPEVIVIAPPEIEDASLDLFKEIFAGSSEKIGPLAAELESKSKELGYKFIDSREVFKSAGNDGIHVSPDQNHNLANKLAEHIK